MKKLQMRTILLILVLQISIASKEHLIGLTVKEAYGDEAKLDNCMTVSNKFPRSAIGDDVSDYNLLLDTSVISL